MAGNPTNWWTIMANAGPVHSSSSPSYQLSPSPSSSHHFYATSDSMPENPAQDFPRSWSQLLLDGANNNNNVLFFSGNRSCPKPPEVVNTHHSPQCNSTSTSSGGAAKKARVHQSSTQPSLKTDTASVLSEAIGYIRFLHTQIQALSSPYLGNASAGSMAHTHQQSEEENGGRDLRSRGLCLVPLSCTQHVGVGSDSINGGGGADYWAPALGGGF
nr:transcription factor bHLH68-like isoform X2 [Ipomoea batatas]